MAQLRADAQLFDSEIHGLQHWQTVARNGLYLCPFADADPEVVQYFGLLHDSMRENDGADAGHGLRAAEYLRTLAEMLPLSPTQLDILASACRTHTYGSRPNNMTIAVCWDADRLDLGRVGITPNSAYLSTPEAKRIADQSDYGCLETVRLSVMENFRSE